MLWCYNEFTNHECESGLNWKINYKRGDWMEVKLFPERTSGTGKKKVSGSCMKKIRKLVELNFTPEERSRMRDHINDHGDHKQHG